MVPLAGGMVAIIVSMTFHAKFDAPSFAVVGKASTVPEADCVWRIILMFAALPVALTYYWRLKMPETARYNALVVKDAKQATTDMSKVLQVETQAELERLEPEANVNSFGLCTQEFAHRHGIHLFVTCSTWFFLDIAICSQNLF
ncbi:hypothetical protein AMTRI_Chr02g262020 [Amborella trichopoda]